MTIANEVDHVKYNGNGATVDFPVPFKIFAKTDLKVVLVDADGVEDVQVLDTDYEIDDADVGTATGNVTFDVAPPSGYEVLIRRYRELSQGTSIRDNGAYNPGSHEDALDVQVMHSQRLAYDLKRCLRVQENEDEDVAQLPPPEDRAGRYLAFDASGNPEMRSEAAVVREKMWVREGPLTTGSNDRFGIYRALQSETYTRLDVQLATVPTGASVTVRLVKNGTTEVGTVTISAGGEYQIATGLNISLVAGDKIRPEITAVGSTTPGETATIRMLP